MVTISSHTQPSIPWPPPPRPMQRASLATRVDPESGLPLYHQAPGMGSIHSQSAANCCFAHVYGIACITAAYYMCALVLRSLYDIGMQRALTLLQWGAQLGTFAAFATGMTLSMIKNDTLPLPRQLGLGLCAGLRTLTALASRASIGIIQTILGRDRDKAIPGQSPSVVARLIRLLKGQFTQP